jgi:hypothetical protein
MEYTSGGDLKKQLDEIEVFIEKMVTFYASEIALTYSFHINVGFCIGT